MDRREQAIKWQLGGVVPDRPMQTGTVILPLDFDVRIDGSDIVWRSTIADEFRWISRFTDVECADMFLWREDLTRQVHAGVGVLHAFTQLHKSDDQKILEFTRRWGVLMVEDLTEVASGRDTEFGSEHIEHLTFWRDLARRAETIITVAALLSQERPPSLALCWQIENDVVPSNLRSRGSAPAGDASVKDLPVLRNLLAMAVNQWLYFGSARPVFSWNDRNRQWNIGLSSHKMLNVWGILALQLMMAVSDKDGLAICSSCHRSYIPPRRPDPTRRNYCPECGPRAAWRDSARERRRRMRETRAISPAVSS